MAVPRNTSFSIYPDAENELEESNIGLYDSQKKTAKNSRSIYVYGLAAAICYSLTYFWRYSIFVLPMDVLEQHVFTLFGTSVDLQTSYSLALTIGFGLAKIFGIFVMSSPFFFQNRFLFLLSLLWISVGFLSIGTLLFYHMLGLQVICIFISCFFTSWIFGGVITYLEGRSGTEALLAMLNFFYIYAGNVSKGVGTLLLNFGVPPSIMPTVMGAIFCPIATVALYVLSCCPPPSQLDIERRSVRVSMSSSDRSQFLSNNALGIVCLLLPYALLAALRGFRDFYAQELFTASLGRSDEPPSYVYFTVDIPGALLACVIQYLFHYCHSNVRAFVGMLLTMCCSILIMLVSTIVYDSRPVTEWSGFCWQALIGSGVYVAYSILNTAAWDRLVSLLEVRGTCSFLVFMADGCGYIGTATLLLYKTFNSSISENNAAGIAQEDGNRTLRQFKLQIYLSCVVMLASFAVAATFFIKKSRLIGRSINASV